MSSFSGQRGPSTHPVLGMYQPDRKGSSSGVSLLDVFDDFLLQDEAAEQGASGSRGVVGPLAQNGDNASADEYDDDDDFDGSDLELERSDGKKRKRIRTNKNMTEEQRVERRYSRLSSVLVCNYPCNQSSVVSSACFHRERNREHAKRSRVRKKFLLESLQHSVKALEEENENLRGAIKQYIPKEEADRLLASCSSAGPSVLASDSRVAGKALDDPDYSLVKALQTAQQNFVITDPSAPDNPIVYASQGFLNLTGYTLEQVLGRNCRFLQGPLTNPRSVEKIRHGIEKGEDTTVVLLNYRRDGSTFWNQFFIAALRDGQGSVVNYLGVQCMVSEEYAQAFMRNAALEEGGKK